MKNDRLFGIIYLLLLHSQMTAKELADYFEVSTRTIYRDIDVLSEMNIPIYMTQGKNGGIGLLENYQIDKTLLTSKEQDEILFSLQGIHQLHTTTNHTYDKLKSLFLKDEESWFEVDFSIWGSSLQHKEMFDLLRESIIRQKVIGFTYYNSKGKQTQRKVEPLKLCFQYNAWYLSAYDQDKQDYRFFKMMRMKNLEILSETFERTTPPQLKTKEPYSKVKLVLQINQTMAYRVYDEFDASCIKQLENGDFLVSIEMPFNDFVYGYILSYGEYIQVIEPLFIKEKIKEKLQKSLNFYL